jgi:hypothetical protein
MRTGPKPRAMPDDFRTFAPGKPILAIMNHYQAGAKAVTRWLEESGVRERPKAAPPTRPVPENFRMLAPTMTMRRATSFWGAGEHLLKRWRDETGVGFKKTSPFRSGGAPSALNTETRRDLSRAGQAAEFLRKLAPVWRCDADGKTNPSGTHWRRNMRVLTDADLIERAEGLGFDPGAWKRLSDQRHVA